MRGRLGAVTFHLYNPGWGVKGGESSGAFGTNLAELHRAEVRAQARPEGQRDPRRVRFGGYYDPVEAGIPLTAKARRALKRITRKGGQVNVSFQLKAVGPDGQVVKRSTSVEYVAENEEDSFR